MKAYNREPKWLYRLESVSPDNGLWYDSDNNLVWGIGKLSDSKTKDLPMDYDERYHKDEKNWFSSCSRKEDLSHWYSLKDAKDLIANGFVFTRYLAVDYVEYEMETTFLKETALYREVINIEDIWDMDNENQEEFTVKYGVYKCNSLMHYAGYSLIGADSAKQARGIVSEFQKSDEKNEYDSWGYGTVEEDDLLEGVWSESEGIIHMGIHYVG